MNAEEERAAVIAFLRQRAATKRGMAPMLTEPEGRTRALTEAAQCERLAGQVERGEHLPRHRRPKAGA